MRFLRIISPHVSRNFKCTPQVSTNIAVARIAASDYCTPSQRLPSERVSGIVDEITGLTLLDVTDLTEALRQKMGGKGIPNMFVMIPGMGFSVRGGAAAKVSPGKAEEKAEKTAFDLKLEGYDAASKVKVIKEVRGFTGLGLKEAKELVEKAPRLMKKGVTKEEAETIITKMKDAGAKVSME